MIGRFESLEGKMTGLDNQNKSHTKNIKTLEKKMEKVEKQNKLLLNENEVLREKLLELEYQQRRSNLIFDGIADQDNGSDLECIRKLRFVLQNIPGLESQTFRIDKCHHIDGKFVPGSNRRVLCTFNWQYDLQCILKNRKLLHHGVYVSEDLPEVWSDRRKILKPIFNAAR